MGNFGGLVLTNKGKNLQAKVQAGAELNFTRIALGDGELGSNVIVNLNSLVNEVKSLSITKEKPMPGGKATIGGILSNQELMTGFYWREIGVFVQDPDEGEILYCYGNAGGTADYIPPGGGSDIIEKDVNVVIIVGNASSVNATIDDSLVYVTYSELKQITTASVAPASVKANDFWFKIV